MAEAGLEGAFWDVYAKQRGVPLAHMLGGTRERVVAGVALGIERDIQQLLAKAAALIERGYRRLKIKIQPGWDFEPLQAVRRRYPDLPLFADANSAYTLADIEDLKRLDGLELAMIEQPLAHDDIVDHAVLQRQLKTPICLMKAFIRLKTPARRWNLEAARVINIKAPRVGGLTEALRIQQALCQEKGTAGLVWGHDRFGHWQSPQSCARLASGFQLAGRSAGIRSPLA